MLPQLDYLTNTLHVYFALLVSWSTQKENAPTPLTALVFTDGGWNLEFGMKVKSVCLCFMTIGKKWSAETNANRNASMHGCLAVHAMDAWAQKKNQTNANHKSYCNMHLFGVFFCVSF